jgi:hypothetical protein
MQFLLILFIVSGFGLAVLSVPLILGKIPPNGLYGFRVRKTMEHPEIWYPVNQYAGKWFFTAGISIIASAILLIFIPGIPLEMYSLAVLAAFVIIFTGALIASFRFLNRL